MPRFRERPLNAALAGVTPTVAALPALLAEVLAPSHFFAAPGLEFVWECGDEDAAWEVFRGRLLDPAHTRERRRFVSWNVVLRGPDPGPPGEPVLSVKWDLGAGELHVVRGLEVYAWEGYDSGGGVFLSRERRKWTRELVGTARLAQFADAEELLDELACLLFLAVVGTSRLPLHSVEAPLPEFSGGRLFDCYRPGRPAGGPLRSWRDLLAGHHFPGRSGRERALWLQAFLLAVPPAQTAEATAALAAAEPDLAALLRSLFREVSLSPWTELVDRVRALLRELEAQGRWTADAVADLLSFLLRQLGRHLTAYDLVVFHYRGANYPDALLLDALLADYLALVERRPDLFAGGDAGRLRRRALRQAWLLRRRYEGHPVPDVPTSPGENARVQPGQPRLPEEQVLQPARRTRRLFADDPLPARLGPHAADALRRGVLDLDDDAELRELGVGVFLDRPFGAGKAPAEPDATPLLTSVAFSRTVAAARLHELARDPATALDADRLAGCLERLNGPAFAAGLPADRVGGPSRPGAISLSDARLAAADFVFLHTTRTSLAELFECLDFTPLLARKDGAFLAGRALLATEPGGAGVLVYDEAWRPRWRLAAAEAGFAIRAGREYPAAGLIATTPDDPGAALRLGPR
jgi:hypothetical protein